MTLWDFVLKILPRDKSGQTLILTGNLLLHFTDLFCLCFNDRQGKARSSSTLKSHPQAPIYEEMTGLQAFGRKPQPRHLEEQASSEYTNCQQKKSCPENHYESPSGALGPRSDAQK